MGGPNRKGALAAIALAMVACGSSAKSSADDAGGAAPVVTTLASSGVEPAGIAVQNTDVYWASVDWGSDAGPSGTGHLQTVSASGGPEIILATATIPFAVAVDATNVYWTSEPNPGEDAGTTGGMFLRMTARTGGATTVIATGVVSSIALGPTGVYWMGTGSSYSLMRTPLGSGASSSLTTLPFEVQAHHLAIDANNVYWAELQPDANGGVSSENIVRMPLTGGAAVTLATFPTTGDYSSLAVGASSVVWVDYDGAVKSVPIAGGAVRSIFSDPSSSATLVAVDGGFVYWATATQVMKAPLAGGSPTVLESPRPGWGPASGFAFDDKSLYVATAVQCTTTPLGGCAVVQKVTPK